MVLVAKDILEKDFLSLRGDATLFQAAQQMKVSHHGFVIVENSEGQPKGIVTEWDILSKVVAEAKDPKNIKLEEIMTKDLITIKPDMGIDELSLFMSVKGIRRVLVVKDGKVLGIITSRTVLARLKDYVDRISTQIARLHSPAL
ncbi:MAG TPA: CBS domain-containing protein [Candidatus Bathyarchaeia archaeon]|nr:CBS domain-containing protein [Candidatus Bathyarchaeia archaeon]